MIHLALLNTRFTIHFDLPALKLYGKKFFIIQYLRLCSLMLLRSIYISCWNCIRDTLSIWKNKLMPSLFESQKLECIKSEILKLFYKPSTLSGIYPYQYLIFRRCNHLNMSLILFVSWLVGLLIQSFHTLD